MTTETLYEMVTRVMKNQELYALTVYRYNYATGQTTPVFYFRNPFCRPLVKHWTLSEQPPTIDGFFPSLTVRLSGYV